MPSSTSSSDTPRPRWPTAFLCALTLFVLSDRLVWSSQTWLRLLARYGPPGAGDTLVTARIELLPRYEPEPPVLLLGSSQVREGLDCAAFEARLRGRTCRNLAIGAGSPLDVLYLSRRIDRRVPRRTTITGLFPKVLHLAPKTPFTDFRTVRSIVKSGSWALLTPREWLDVAYGLLEQHSETLRQKDALLAAYGVVRPDLEKALRYEMPPAPPRLLQAQERQPESYFRKRLHVLDGDARKPGAFTPAQEAALEAFIAAETSRGNRTILVDFPTRPGYESTLPQETLAHYRALVERLSQGRDITLVTPKDLPPLGVDDFLDFTHLADSGRARVSERLAEILADLDGP